MNVKPSPGLKIINPATRQPLPPEGIEVVEPIGTYWANRIRTGDVVVVEPQSPKSDKKVSKPKLGGA